MPDPRIPVTGELLSAAVDGELTAAEQAAVDAALAADPALRRELEALRAVKAAVRRAGPVLDLPTGLLARLDAGYAAIDAAPRLRRSRPGRRGAWLAAVAVAAVVAGLVPVVRHRGPQPPTVSLARLDLAPANLAEAHQYWQAKYAGRPRATATPRQLAVNLQQDLGTAVRPPDVQALSAELVGCAGCGHAVPGRRIAVFVLRCPQLGDVTLFELPAGAAEIRLAEFEPSDIAGVSTAQVGAVKLAVWTDGQWLTGLASTTASPAALARLAPRAVLGACGDQPPADPAARPPGRPL